MTPHFSWDPRKAAGNLRKHGVSFQEAATAFKDAYSISTPDPDHSSGEIRFLLIGVSIWNRLLVVAHAERGDELRIISARLATRRERENYEEGK